MSPVSSMPFPAVPLVGRVLPSGWSSCFICCCCLLDLPMPSIDFRLPLAMSSEYSDKGRLLLSVVSGVRDDPKLLFDVEERRRVDGSHCG